MLFIAKFINQFKKVSIMEYSIFTNGLLFVAVSNKCNLTKSNKPSNENMVSSAMYNLFAISDYFIFVCYTDDNSYSDFLIAYK